MSNRSIQEKIAMWKENPHCYWCGIETVVYTNVPRDFVFPDNAATIDHVYPINDPRRLEFKKKKKPSPVVLACKKCNWERGSKSLEKTEKKFNKTDREFWTNKKIMKVTNYQEKWKKKHGKI